MCICVERIDVIGHSFYAIFINYTSRRLIAGILALGVARQPLKEEPSEEPPEEPPEGQPRSHPEVKLTRYHFPTVLSPAHCILPLRTPLV